MSVHVAFIIYKFVMYIPENGGDNDTSECMPRAVDEFPDNFFTLKQTQDGAMAVHILLAIYMFGALAIVCDDYFVPSLEAICEREWNIYSLEVALPCEENL